MALCASACGSSDEAPPPAATTPTVVDERRGDIPLSMQAETMSADATHLYVLATWELVRVPKTGGLPATLATGELVNSTEGIAVDDDFVYWTHKGARAGEGSIRRVRKIGGAVEEYVTKVTDPCGVAVDAENVYWTEDHVAEHVFGERDGRVVAMPKGEDGAGEPIVLASDALPKRMIVTRDHVYWTTAPSGGPNARIRRVAKAGGEPETLVDGRAEISDVAVSADGDVAWTQSNSEDGGVFVRHSDGSTDVIARGRVGGGVAASAGNVYFARYDDGTRGEDSRGGTILAHAAGAPLARTVREVAFPDGASSSLAGGLVVDAQRVYWFDAWLSGTGGVGAAVRSAPR